MQDQGSLTALDRVTTSDAAARYRRLWLWMRAICLPSAVFVVSLAGMYAYQWIGFDFFNDLPISYETLSHLAGLRGLLTIVALIIGTLGLAFVGGYTSAGSAAGTACAALAGCSITIINVIVYLERPVAEINSDFLALDALIAISTVLVIASYIRLRRTKLNRHSLGPTWVATLYRRLVKKRRQSYRVINHRNLYLLAAMVFVTLAAYFLRNWFSNTIAAKLILGIDATELFAEYSTVDQVYSEEKLRFLLWVFVDFGLLIAMIALLVFLWRSAWRRVRRSAKDILSDPSYRPIVFLRSFQEEDARVRPRRLLQILIRQRPRLEEVIVNRISRLGPAVAIGVPNERVPKLGAFRAYYSDDEWKDAVLDWMNRSYLIVMFGGASRWTVWELGQAFANRQASRLVLMLPPDSTALQRQQRWAALCAAAEETQWSAALAAIDPKELSAVVFGADGRVISIAGHNDDQVSAEITIQTAVVANQWERAAVGALL